MTAVADFPLLQIADARLAGVPQELLWQQLRLPEVNEELRGVLSASEQAILASEGAKELDLVSQLKREIRACRSLWTAQLSATPNSISTAELDAALRSETQP